jgi:hypothetical protein
METAESHQNAYEQREALKKVSRAANHQMGIVLAHWDRCAEIVSLSDYASQWAAARPDEEVAELKLIYPLRGPRMIADNCSDWNSYGKPGYYASA